MDQQLVQRTRYQLQTRFRRLRTAGDGNFELICKQVLDWLENHPILSSVLHHLDSIPGDHHREIQALFAAQNIDGMRYSHSIGRARRPNQNEEIELKGESSKTFEEHAAACLEVLRAALQKPNVSFYYLLAVFLTGEEYSVRVNKNPHNVLRDIATHDLYEYLDEQLDGINALNGLLQKYKQNVEWFQIERIQQIIEQGYAGRKGERALAVHLQQYIFDQGVEFVIEPSSHSGEVDLLLRDSSGQYSIVDAKLINTGATTSSEVTKKIAQGFNQVSRYCVDYNQPEGFLAVFVNDDISILLADVEQNDAFRFFKIGGSVIYYIEINISERPSASKSGKAKQITITRDQLLEKIEEVQSE